MSGEDEQMTSVGSLIEPLARRDPKRIGSYTLLGRLGAGAMGQVYLGRSAAGRLLAVKTIRGEFVGEPDFRNQFAQEVAAARRVSGAFTAPVVAADPDAETPWLATSYVAAPSLAQLVRACGPLPPAAVRWLAAGCAEALDSIHEAGLVHRDLKPSNVLISLDGPRVIDFGVARVVERAASAQTRHAVGTPAYMAPEQARGGQPVTTAADVFSLGSTLLFAATGHPPYQGDTATDVLVRLATEPPDLSGLDSELEDLVLWCLAREPTSRPAPGDLLRTLAGEDFTVAPLPSAARSLIEDYGQVGGDTDGSTFDSLVIARPPRPPANWRRRANRVVSAVVAIGGVAGLLVLGSVLGGSSQVPVQTGGSAQEPLPPGPPPVPLSGATDRPTGNPAIVVNQPFGDRDTVFVVHGTGWPPGARITMRLGGQVSPATPTVDRAGTFNYAINQNHEFFPGRLPPGILRVVATSGSARAETGFRVAA
jgi:serine/threonine protein kinase